MYLFTNPTVNGRLIKRINRFVAVVDVDGQTVLAHVANSGRMQELLFPGNRVVLQAHSGKERKTPYDLILAEYGGFLVSVDSRLPNFLIADAIDRGLLPGFTGLRVARREVVYGESRLDLKLVQRENSTHPTNDSATNTAPDGRAINASATNSSTNMAASKHTEGFAEIKSCTLVRDGCALFPDAPTARGARHLRELMRAFEEGYLAYVIFLIQRNDAVSFAPNDSTDPEFGKTLREAAARGVEIKAYTCQVSETGVEVVGEVPVLLSF